MTVASKTRNMQSLVLLATVIFGIILIFLCGSNSTKRIIVDVDGGVDDFQALVMLLNAEHEGFVKIEAIVCTHGNTNLHNVGTNVLRLLETVQRTDIPVYFGSYNNILPNEEDVHWYGSDGFGDLHYKRSVQTTPRKELGIVAMKDLLLHNPKQISIVCLGPLTNIGMLLRIYNISKNIKEIFIMGGNYLGTEADFNFKSDPEAASIVLSTAHCPIKLLTWQACSNVTTNLQWRFDIRIDNPVWNLNERAERALYNSDYLKEPNTTYRSCDGILGSMLMHPQIVTNSSKHATSVDLCNNTRGLVVIDDSNHKKNAEMITSINSETFKADFAQHFIDICNNYKCLDIF